MTIWSVMTAVIVFAYIVLRVTHVPCLRPKLVQNYNLSQFLGNWYEIKRTFGLSFEKGDCGTAQYALKSDGSGIDVINTQWFLGEGKKGVATGSAYTSKWDSGHNNVYFFGEFAGDYRVVDTDYNNYAIVYACTEILGGCINFSNYMWYLSRTKLVPGTMSHTTFVNQMDAIVKDKLPGLNQLVMYTTVHGGTCQYPTGM